MGKVWAGRMVGRNKAILYPGVCFPWQGKRGCSIIVSTEQTVKSVWMRGLAAHIIGISMNRHSIYVPPYCRDVLEKIRSLERAYSPRRKEKVLCAGHINRRRGSANGSMVLESGWKLKTGVWYWREDAIRIEKDCQHKPPLRGSFFLCGTNLRSKTYPLMPSVVRLCGAKRTC